MLNYLFVMLRVLKALLLTLIALLTLASIAASPRQETPPAAVPTAATQTSGGQIAILSPTDGQAMQGVVELVFRTNVTSLVYAELSFAYTDDPTGTWFLLYESNQPAERATVEWNTGAITDGNYTLRLRATLEDGTTQSTQVENLRVRNYSPVETDTPPPPVVTQPPAPSATPTAAGSQAEVPPQATAGMEATPTKTPEPTAVPQTAPAPPTPPHNPAAIQPEQVSRSLLRGGVAVLGIFALVGLYGSLKRLGK